MHSIRTNKAPLVVGAILSSAASFGALAHDGVRSLGTAVAESEFVFHGVVERIEYALSNPAGDEGIRVPFTFVTYRVNDVLRGEADGEVVTLRFIGGLNRETGRYMATSRTPQFDLGDEDILFVRGNTQTINPFVGQTDGRLRVIDGQVYTENGHSVNIALDGTMEVGARFLLEEAATTNVEGHVFQRDLGPEARIGPSDAMLAADLLHDIAFFAANAPAPQNAFASADVSEPFDGPTMTAAPAPALSAEEREAQQNAPANAEPAEAQLRGKNTK